MDPDQLIAEIASRQYGVISRAQALGAGLTPPAITRRLASRRWLRLHSEVYALAGVPVSWHQTMMAAVLWGGPGSAASHRAAGYLWDLDGVDRTLEISTPRRLVSDAVVSHRRARMSPPDLKLIDGVPTTGIDRTLLDLATVLGVDELEDALDAALRKRLTTVPRLRLRLKQESGKRGTSRLRKLMEERCDDGQPTQSRFETRLQRLLLKEGLPPLRQFTVWDGGEFIARVDFCYPDAKLIVEADSYRWHSGKRAWQRDIERRNRLTALGWQIIHITWEDLVRRPGATAARVRRLTQPQLFNSASG